VTTPTPSPPAADEGVRTTVRITGHAALLVRADMDRTGMGPSAAVADLVGEHADVLAAEVRRQRWTLPEVGAVADVLNGVLLGPGIGALAYGEVADAARLDEDRRAAGLPGEGYLDRWGVEPSELLDRLLRLGPAGDLALRRAVAEWWHRDLPHTVDGWAQVGLVVVDG